MHLMMSLKKFLEKLNPNDVPANLLLFITHNLNRREQEIKILNSIMIFYINLN